MIKLLFSLFNVRLFSLYFEIRYICLAGTPPSNDVPYGPYPISVKKRNGKKCLVVQDFAYGKYLGRLNVNFSATGDVISWSGNPILLDHKVPKDSDIMKDIARMRGPLDIVGKACLNSLL